MISRLSQENFAAGLIGVVSSVVEPLLPPNVEPYVATLISLEDGEFLVQQFVAGVNIKGGEEALSSTWSCALIVFAM